MAHRASAAAAAAVRARWAPCRASGATPDDAARAPVARVRRRRRLTREGASVPRESADARVVELQKLQGVHQEWPRREVCAVARACCAEKKL